MKSAYVEPARIALNPLPGGRRAERGLFVNVLSPRGVPREHPLPVLYLLHGRADSYAHWGQRDAGAIETLLEGFAAHVVMPEGDRGWYTDWWKDGKRGDPAWERHYLDELVPLVERRIAIRKGRRWRAIAGLSMGGTGALVLAARRPDYFGSAAAFSAPLSIQRSDWPSLLDTDTEDHRQIYGDPREQGFYWSGHNPTALVENLRHTRVYASVGDGTPDPPDIVTDPSNAETEFALGPHLDDFSAAASAARVDVRTKRVRGSHEWPTWRRSLTDAVDWGLFEAANGAPEAWTYNSVAQRGRMWDVVFEFDRPPSGVWRFERRPQSLKGTGAGAVTLRTPGLGEVRAELPCEIDLSSEVRARRD